MAKGDSIKGEIRLEQKKALEGKSLGYKLKYFLHYYKFSLVAVIIVLIIVCSLVKTIASYKTNVLGIALINANEDVNYNEFISEYEKVAGIGKKEEMSIDASYNFRGDDGLDMQLEQKLFVSVAADQVDVIIAPKTYFDKYAEGYGLSGIALKDISSIIRDSWYKDLDEEVYMGIIADSANTSRALEFLEYLQK